MKKLFFLPMLCFCFLLTACGGSSSPSPEQSLPQDAHLNVPVSEDYPSVFITVNNTTSMQEYLKGTILALMQSEHGAREADAPEDADYIIDITISKFNQVGSETSSASAADMALPGIAGATLGAQIGGSFDGSLVGAGIGLVAGVALGSMLGSEEMLVWQSEMQLSITDANEKKYATKLTPQAKGAQMNAQNAAALIENSAAWSVVHAFRKNN